MFCIEHRTGNPSEHQAPLLSRDPIPTYFFAVVVVRKDDQYLLVHEQKERQEWYLPAGRVEVGEQLASAAVRETLEESGVPVRLTGVIRVEHTAAYTFSRIRVIYLAEPTSNVAPKSFPDDESLGAEWVRLKELHQYPLRGDDVRNILQYVDDGGTVFPLDVLSLEHSPFLPSD